MRRIELTDDDAEQVKAILMTHAEMQDHRTLMSEEVIARLKHEEPDEFEMVCDLEDSVCVLTDDSENLKRIARFF